MQQSRWERFAPLTGVVFVVMVTAIFTIGGSTPSSGDSAAKVQAFYSAHSDKHMTLAYVMMITLPFMVFFASSLRNDLRRAGGTGQLANAAFGAGILTAVGFGALAFVHLALADAADSAKTLSATQALNILDGNDFVLPVAGLGTLTLATGLAVVRHGGLPKWLGWLGIVIGVLIFTPAGFFGFLASGIWIVIVSIMLTVARGRTQPAAAAPAA